MSTQDIVENFLRETREEGRQEGRQEMLAEAILQAYAERLGPPPAEIEAIVQQTHDQAILRGWFKLVVTATADDMLRAIKG